MADEGRSLAPKKRPGSEPKLDDGARRLLESDVEERPAATLLRRREHLQKVGGVRVSGSTVSRMLERMGWGRKKDRWVRAKETSSRGLPGRRWSPAKPGSTPSGRCS